MNHTSKCRLLVYMDENPGDLSGVELSDYLWLVEQLLQEVRQRVLERRTAAAQVVPFKP